MTGSSSIVTEPVEVSNSEITMFKNCRRQWWLTYYRKLRPIHRDVVGALPFGSRIHAALEMYYKERSDPLTAHAGLVEEARLDLMANGEDTSKLDEEAELGRIMLEGYMEWVEMEGIDSDLEVIGVEEVLKHRMDLANGSQVVLIGKIDLRVLKRRTGTRAVLDIKTAASFDPFNATVHMNPQLKTYQLLDRIEGDPSTRIDGGMFRLLKKVKRTARATPPFYQDIYVQHNDFTMRTFWNQLQGVLMEMDITRTALDQGGDTNMFAFPNPTRDCTWRCKFYQVCPLFDDGSAVDSAIADMYTVGNPYDYYRDRSQDEMS
jgi:RecB family exonuclease